LFWLNSELTKDNKTPLSKIDSNFWIFNFDQIEDRTRRNYYALLPDEALIKSHLPEMIVINKPAGTVGGDGYWVHAEGGVMFLALYDCVGQGHLASMMTRIYSNALKKLIVENAIHYPGSVIQFIHREIKSKFSDKEKIKLNTGADLGILRINVLEKTIEFAGANLDLVLISKNEIDIIKGGAMSIGEAFDTNHSFNSNTLQISHKTTVFLHSDGIVDLMGGPDYKKLGATRLYDFLRSIHHFSLEEQRLKINTFIRDWSGAHPQNDDVLILGFTLD
jgi:serine phosphatase RsbU (regulator of sigma subunit)